MHMKPHEQIPALHATAAVMLPGMRQARALLDATISVALGYPTHVHHRWVVYWLADQRALHAPSAVKLATCAITELAFVRIASGTTRLAAGVAEARIDLLEPQSAGAHAVHQRSSGGRRIATLGREVAADDGRPPSGIGPDERCTALRRSIWRCTPDAVPDTLRRRRNRFRL